MSKLYPFSALFDSVDVEFPVPSSYEEFDNALGETGAALDEGITNTILRHTAPRFYDALSAKLALPSGPYNFPKKQAENDDGTPMVRVTKTKGDVPVMERSTAHLARYVESADDATRGAFFADAQEIAKAFPFFDKSAPSAARGAGKVSKANLDAANGMIAAGSDRVEKVVAFIESTVPGYKVTREEDESVSAESLGRAIAALDRHEKAKALAARNAALAGL